MATANEKVRRQKLIKRSLFLAEVSQAEVGREVGVCRSMVGHVAAGRKNHVGVQEAIARVCNMTVEQLWGV